MNFYDYEAEDAGFEILDFPCNQFGNQAPGTCLLYTSDAADE